MITTTQTGTFKVGTSGFPVFVQIPDDLSDPNYLANVASIHLTYFKPDGSIARDADLTLPGAISDVHGIVVFNPAVGELSLKGIYRLVLTVTYSSPVAVQVVSGDFKVEK